MTIDREGRTRPAPRVGAWAAEGFVLYILLGPASLLATAIALGWLAPFGWVAEAGTAAWGVRLAAQPPVWGVTVAVAATWLGRGLIPDLRPARGAALFLALGLALAAMTTYLLHEFVRERYGTFDPEYAGFVLFAAPAIVAAALVTWARTAVPRNHGSILLLLQVAATAGFGLVILPSVGGLGDGIRETSIPMAVILVLDAIYVMSGLVGAAHNRPMHAPVEPRRNQ